MATVTIPEEDRTLKDADEIGEFLGRFGIWYRRFEGNDTLGDDATDEDVLGAYADMIDEMKAEGGYETADVINVTPDIENLDAMLAKFQSEHTHSEDEVRFIVSGSGLFHVNPDDGPVFRIEVFGGDMINVPAGTKHWFHVCKDRRIRAVRLFQNKSGWTPHYTESGVAEGYQPLCFGPAYIPPSERLDESVI